jgi:HEAT repeat protein
MALAEIADPSTVEALTERLTSDEYVPVRAEAARALGRIGTGAARTALERSLRTETEDEVKEAVRRALSPPASPGAPSSDRPRSRQ